MRCGERERSVSYDALLIIVLLNEIMDYNFHKDRIPEI